jgi:hypothetical protein
MKSSLGAAPARTIPARCAYEIDRAIFDESRLVVEVSNQLWHLTAPVLTWIGPDIPRCRAHFTRVGSITLAVSLVRPIREENADFVSPGAVVALAGEVDDVWADQEGYVPYLEHTTWLG